jgi:hypothetical protein
VVAAIREIGNNTGSMRLKGASSDHHGPEAPDRWPVSNDLAEAGQRHGIIPSRDLAFAG